MDVREKLVELLTDNLPRCGNLPRWDNPLQLSCDEQVQRIADHLIMNGVTVQEWISVEDRLPEPFVPVLVQMPGEEPFPTVREGFISNDGIWQSAMFRREPGEVTHWKPMPQPPKGE